MRFWDTSAVVPLLVDEPLSAWARGLAERDAELVVWWGTSIECWSALARRRREERIATTTEDEAGRRIEILRSAWYEIMPGEEVRLQAKRLLRVHPLRAADALQLAAGLVWAGSAREAPEFVCADERLVESARLEGLLVIRPQGASNGE